MSTVTLAMIYNHQFEPNVPRLQAMYETRFDRVLHLMPFASSHRDNVVPVYDSSFQFQGYIAQALTRLLERPTDYYVFCGDDLILAPDIAAANIEGKFSVTPHTGFIKEWTPLPEASFWWWNFMAGLQPFRDESHGTEWRSQLPPPGEALTRMSRHGYRASSLTLRNYRRGQHFGASRRAALAAARLMASSGLRYEMPYPLAMGYSDLVIVPRAALPEFARICGVMAAMRVHVEVAIPTALALSVSDLASENTVQLGGIEHWEDQVELFETRYDRNLTKLLNDLEGRHLWVHPVKLSRWKEDQ